MEKENIRVFNTLQEQYEYLGVPVDLIDNRIDFTIFNLKDVMGNLLPFRAPTNRLNFFVFNFIKQGSGKYTIDDHTFSLQPRTVYFTNPGHYRSYEWTSIGEVHLITFSEAFLKQNGHANIFEEFPFLLTETFPARVVSEAVFSELEHLYLQILKEYRAQSPFRTRLIAGLFVILLFKLKEYCWLDYNPIYEGNRSSLIVKNFRKMLEQHYRDARNGKVERLFRVQDYAEAQNLHPNYLSTVIKNKTGKAIGTWITEKTITEAKTLLQSSDISIKEVAYRLGFLEPAHFTNYFKKHTNSSPVTYRKSARSSDS